MAARPIRSILPYGYGTMARGVATTFAAASFETPVRSRKAAEIEPNDTGPG